MRYAMLGAALLLAGAVTAQERTPAADKPRSEADKPRSDVEQVLDGAGNAVERPLKDLGIVPIKAPADLTAIMNKPYDLGRRPTCASLRAEIVRMNGLLGPDVDEVKGDGKRTAAEKVAGGLEGLTGGIIPGQGLIREVTGANAAARRRAAAILAGNLRRAYAKGMARARGCRA